jgi:hypothetical protein
MGMFENKNVFITGAAGGIGKAISIAFAKEGAKIALIDLDKKGLEESLKELKSKNTVIKTYLLDVTKEKMVKEVVSKVLEDFPCIDILVNNAGVSTMNWFWKLTEEEWDLNLFDPGKCVATPSSDNLNWYVVCNLKRYPTDAYRNITKAYDDFKEQQTAKLPVDLMLNFYFLS